MYRAMYDMIVIMRSAHRHLSDVTPRVEPHFEARRRVSAQSDAAHAARLALGERLPRSYDVTGVR